MVGQEFWRADGSAVEDGSLRLPLWRFAGVDFRLRQEAAHELAIPYPKLVAALMKAEAVRQIKSIPLVVPDFKWVQPPASDEESSAGASSSSPADDALHDPDWTPGTG